MAEPSLAEVLGVLGVEISGATLAAIERFRASCPRTLVPDRGLGVQVLLEPSSEGWEATSLEALGELELQTVGGAARAHHLMVMEWEEGATPMVPAEYLPIGHQDDGIVFFFVGVGAHEGELCCAFLEGQDLSLTAHSDFERLGPLSDFLA